MYERFFGLSGKPFSLLPDADFLFYSKRHKRAVNLLEYGILTEAGFLVISGDVGAGKTTIIRRYLKTVGNDVSVGVVTNPTSSGGSLMNWVAHAFDMPQPEGEGTQLYHRFVDFLVQRYAQGKRAVLIIDEAQNLDAARLEELRMLSNINNEKDQLLQIVLVGQPEMLETLKGDNLRQFVQRISVHCHLDPLVPPETAAYIRHRLSVVGGGADIFDDEACAAVHFFTGGVPRLINLLCDQALVYAFSEDQKDVSAPVVAEVALDRARSGLSPFRAVPEGWEITRLKNDTRQIMGEIRKG